MFSVEKNILSNDLTCEKCSGLLSIVIKILMGDTSKNVLKSQ